MSELKKDSCVDMIIDDGSTFMAWGKTQDTKQKCFIFLKEEPGKIGRYSEKYKKGDIVEDYMLRITFTNPESVKVFKEVVLEQTKTEEQIREEERQAIIGLIDSQPTLFAEKQLWINKNVLIDEIKKKNENS